jgi:rSAM/selenodomain-associated transferase 2
LSVIIPTLNEEAFLPATLEVLDPAREEVIVVDAGSTDRTVAIATRWGARVIQAPRGRAQQMNAGAKVAGGEAFLFLHADTLLPSDFALRIRDAIDRGAGGGAFTLSVDDPRPAYRWIEAGVRFRSRFLGLSYGDQALFVSRSAFEEVRGFREIEIMEDFDFARGIRRRGKFALLDARVSTSARRWRRAGTRRLTFLNQATVLGYLLGVPTQLLARWYGRFTAGSAATPSK